MTYQLVVGNKNYSSWSMRAWLALRVTGAPFTLKTISIYTPDSRSAVAILGGETGLVPVLIDGDLAIWDTLAIIEYLAERHGGLWPEAPFQRARARSYSGELHSGFRALRDAMPVNTRARRRIAELSPPVEADIARIQTIWDRAEGEWLFGAFSAADIMFAPVATRLRTYGVPLGGVAADYCQRLLAHRLVIEWCGLGAAERETIPMLELPEASAP